MAGDGTTPRERAPGDVLEGRYRLVERLGRGGFGDVWRAEELLPGGASFREVALKLLTSGVTDVANWAEEAKLLASFRHPSLVTIYAAGILADREPQPYVAMELLIGDSLADHVKKRGRLAWRLVLRWARDVAAALDVIHRHGVVHLDLKPANLFLSTEGALKVLDFGIAKRAGAPASRRAELPAAYASGVAADPELASMATAQFLERSAPTGPAAGPRGADDSAYAATQQVDAATERAVIGTPGFMAPEVIEQGEPTAATDAYALAVCVVQLATGHLPQAVDDEPSLWTDPTAVSAWWTQLRNATLRGELRDLARDPAGLPRGLVALLHRLLAVDPAARRVAPGGLFAIFDEAWHRPHGVAEPPYPGLAPLGPQDEGMLFGRDDDLARLGRELEYEPCVVLQGARGVGKTSLALAGLVPYLARLGADGKDDWIAARVDPARGGDADLDRALGELDADLAGRGADELAAFAASSPIGVVLVVDRLDAAAAGGDQAIRLAAVLEAIAGAQRRPGLRLVATLREDQTAALLATPLGAALRASLRFVGGPTAAAVDDIVATPARLAGATVTRAEVPAAEVQRELRADGALLPLVALALAEWWASREGGSLRGEAWKELGGISGALVRHADRVTSAMSAAGKALGGELLARLSSTDGTPVRWPPEELIASLGIERGSARWSDAESTLAALEREHLVRVQGGEIAIAHESLLTGWPHLLSVRLAAMDRIAFRERLREAAAAWERAGNHADFLWRGALFTELGAHRDWLAGGLSHAEQEFVRESSRLARRTRYLRLASVAALGLLVAGGLFYRAASEAEQAQVKREREAALAQAYLSEVVARSRRTEDPFYRAAWIAEAMEKRSTDGMLPLDLAGAVANVPPVKLLTLDRINGAEFHWDDRWLIGRSSGPTITVIDLLPSDSDVIEDVPLDFDPEQIKRDGHSEPRAFVIRPHADPVADLVPFPFDTSLVTSSVTGDVRVWRMRETGVVSLAAIAPSRCTGGVHTAEAAPVVACATDDGIVRWDLRAPAKVSRVRFLGTVLDVSPDGERVAAANHRRVLLWEPDASIETEHTAEGAVVDGRWSPRDRVLGLVEDGAIEIVDHDRPGAPIFRAKSDSSPVSMRWDPGGLDLAVCGRTGEGQWHYLRRGGRAATDPPAPSPAKPCVEEGSKRRPEPVRGLRDFGRLAERDLGPHLLPGGWKLPHGRWLTSDLVLVLSAERATAQLLHFSGRDGAGVPEPSPPGDSVSAVVRDGDDAVAFQVGGEVRVYRTATGRRVSAHAGNLLHRCADGRLMAWLKEGATWRVLDAKSDATIGSVAREPGIILGGDLACTTLFWQRLDGTLVASPLSAGPGAAGRPLAVADGYVFDARRSAGGPGVEPGLVLAVSSGAIVRVDDGGAVRVLGYATPRATAIGDGPEPGDVAYADSTGVVVLRRSGEIARVLAAPGGAVWEDLAMSSDGGSMLLASAEKLSVLDLARGEILGDMPVDGLGRLARWDDEGSVLAWSFDRTGGAAGLVIPRGLALTRRIARAVSNVEVVGGKLGLRR